MGEDERISIVLDEKMKANMESVRALFTITNGGNEPSTNEIVARLLEEKVGMVRMFMEVYVKYGQARTAEQISKLLSVEREKNDGDKVSSEGKGV